jgi:hypothetical protein
MDVNRVFNLEKNIIHRGFVPELVSVRSGSYASDSSYGVGAALKFPTNFHSYGSAPGGYNLIVPRGGGVLPLLPSETGCDIRVEDSNVTFACTVSLSGTVPVLAAGELRIRPTPTTIPQPNRWNVPFPLALIDGQQSSPVFDVVLRFASGDVPTLANVPKARLLANGWLALFTVDPADNSETALTNAFITANVDNTDTLNISIQGQYLTH